MGDGGLSSPHNRVHFSPEIPISPAVEGLQRRLASDLVAAFMHLDPPNEPTPEWVQRALDYGSLLAWDVIRAAQFIAQETMEEPS